MWSDKSTELAALAKPLPIRGCVLDDGTTRFELRRDRLTIGSHPSNDCVVDDRTVSRFHCEIEMRAEGAWLKDLGSRNGTVVDGLTVREALLRNGSTIRLGHRDFRFSYGAEGDALTVSDELRFGRLVGTSIAMRSAFFALEQAARADATLLLEGETGTGKDAAAESVHEASARREGPFVVVDCSALPDNLIESELFGHEKGAFTGASARRIGAFETAAGGTVFLDEIGELPTELQPRLLRVLEHRSVQRVGSSTRVPVDVRVIAATNRDLRVEVNHGRFRSDLYYRLAVLRVRLPALRERPDDLPMIVEQLLEQLGARERETSLIMDHAFLERLECAAWPGNVRELRNYLERCMALDRELPIDDQARAVAPSDAPRIDVGVSYATLRRKAHDEFERAYLVALMAAHRGNVSKAAEAAGLHRVYLHRMLKKHGIKS